MEARAPHDFEHDALVPGPGNAEHFSSAFTTWRKVKVGKILHSLAFPSPFHYPIIHGSFAPSRSRRISPAGNRGSWRGRQWISWTSLNSSTGRGEARRPGVAEGFFCRSISEKGENQERRPPANTSFSSVSDLRVCSNPEISVLQAEEFICG